MMRDLGRLLRVPNTLTAFGDAIAGAALATAVDGDAIPAASVAGCGVGLMLLYGFGAGLNDVVDRKKDAVLHPERPLPSGALSPRVAAGAVASAGTTGLIVLTAVNPSTLPLAVMLCIAIIAYDVFCKHHTVLGPLAMGACRGLAIGCGVAAVGVEAWDRWQLPAVMMLAYTAMIACVTAVSRFEETPARRLPTPLAVMLALTWVSPAVLGHPQWIGALGSAYGIWIVIPILGRTPRALTTVKRAVFGLPLFDALICLACNAPILAGACLVLWPAVHGLARVIGQRGS